MNFVISEGIVGVRPPVTKPHPGFLYQLGEDGMRTLIDKHYELLRISDIGFLFPINDEDDFEQAKQNAADFFIQICGGYSYFNENRGEPKIVGRHAPFRIDQHARKRWLELYIQLLPQLEQQGVNQEYIQSFWEYLDIFSMWTLNS